MPHRRSTSLRTGCRPVSVCSGEPNNSITGAPEAPDEFGRLIREPGLTDSRFAPKYDARAGQQSVARPLPALLQPAALTVTPDQGWRSQRRRFWSLTEHLVMADQAVDALHRSRPDVC